MDGVRLFGVSPDSIAKMVKRAGGRVPIRCPEQCSYLLE
jgi:hypothetical protein